MIMKTIFSLLFAFVILGNTMCYAQYGSDITAAAEAGNAQAQYDLGLINLQQGDYHEAMKWLTKSSNQGNSNAQFNLAIMYRDGEGCTVNYQQALYWFKKAAENSTPRKEACGEVGKLYQYGLGVAKDISIAMSWYKKGANMGDIYCMDYVGRIYRDSGDMNQALMWFRMGADAGNEECACYVYYLLEDSDLKTALVYLKKSADGGYPNGMAWYGIRQMFGEGIAKDEKKGYDLVIKAAVKRSEVAMKFLSEYKVDK